MDYRSEIVITRTWVGKILTTGRQPGGEPSHPGHPRRPRVTGQVGKGKVALTVLVNAL